MNRFKPGQKVVCIKNGLWDDKNNDLVVSPARYNEIYTVVWCGRKCHYAALYISLAEVETGYFFRSDKFAPLVSDEVLEAELNTIEVYEKV